MSELANRLARWSAGAKREPSKDATAQPQRLAEGGLVDRQKVLGFSFDGKSYCGFQGDTLASALLANGVRLVGRSFKYHRPRGILSAGPEEPNALVELRAGQRREPNTRATTAELFDGLVAQSQNRWPSLRFDLMSLNALASPMLAAGFYYKTFMWPPSFWEKIYEPAIRRAAGLGRVAPAPDPDRYERAFAFCDVLVIGAGPAGLMAALAAARAGARVILCDQDFEVGGRLIAERREVGGQSAADFARARVAELAAMPEVRILRRTVVFGAYDHGTYGAVEQVNDHVPVPPEHEPRQRMWHIIAKRAVLASGAIERPLVFGRNDRPGVMLAGAVRTYINRFAVRPGARAVIFGNNGDAALTVRDLRAAGIRTEAIIDPRPEAAPLLGKAAAEAGARLVTGAVTCARGGQSLRGVEVRAANGETLHFACDLLAVSGGWQPTIHLTSHLGGRPDWNDALASFVPGTLPRGMSVAGAARGDFTLADCLAGGARAGGDAASACGFRPVAATIPRLDPESVSISPLWRVRGSKSKAFVDFQNDVTTGDVELAEREGFHAVEHLKRYTTLGMATDQGKTANVNGLALMAELTKRSVAETGTTRFRPPYTAVTIGALAGPHRGKEFRPMRLTTGHEWAQEQGAVFMEAGLWMRAQNFPRTGEDLLAATNREVTATRASVGVCDVSTLGKIDVQGPDAAAFLDRLYCNTFSTLPLGRARYGLMLREDGFVMDDGTTSRLADDRFLVTTTTANAGKVMQHMDFCHQVLWPDLDVQFVSVTEQWAQYAIAGPRARDVLRRIVDARHDLSNEAFPYMAAGAIGILGALRARLFRISFSGELAYELAVPSASGDTVIRAIMHAGAEHGITPYGLEALGVMRVEKGHCAGGELNGRTTARDLGLARMMSTKKDFIGRVMARRPALVAPERPILVGLKPVNPTAPLNAGAHFLDIGAQACLRNDQGYLTSAAFSPTLGHAIGLGLLANGRQRIGERVRAWDAVRGHDIEVEICQPDFLDPEGVRLRG